MGRAENRRDKRKAEKNVQAISKLTPGQNALIKKMAIEKADIYITNTANIINKCYFDAMRSNGISEVRANKILAETEKNIKIEADKDC